MARHTMTPARRAALRKAQIASARSRRKNTARKAISRSVRQSASSAKASGTLASRGAVKRFNSPANKARRRKIVKGVVVAAAVGTVAAGAVHGAKHRSTLHSGGRNSVRSMDYRQRRAAYRDNLARHQASVRSTRTGAPRKALTGSQTRSLAMGPKGRAVVKRRETLRKKRNEAFFNSKLGQGTFNF